MINNEQLSSLSLCLSGILTHKEIDRYLNFCGIANMSVPTMATRDQFGFQNLQFGTSKRDKIFNSLSHEIRRTGSEKCLSDFIETVFEPSQYIDKKDQFESMRETMNKRLMMIGLEVSKEGKVSDVQKAKTIDEVDQRVLTLYQLSEERNFHKEVFKYCKREFLNQDYFHAAFEAVKGLYQRIRDLTGLTTDGQELIEKAFAKNAPYLFFGSLHSESAANEREGFKFLLIALQKMTRNPAAHDPRLLAIDDLQDCLEVLTMVSRAHHYLDICQRTCIGAQN
jgi:uncharacterized protein (TIGR02391 family)